MKLGTPSISVDQKTNEQNIQAIKGYLNNMSQELEYVINNMESRLNALETENNELKRMISER